VWDVGNGGLQGMMGIGVPDYTMFSALLPAFRTFVGTSEQKKKKDETNTTKETTLDRQAGYAGICVGNA